MSIFAEILQIWNASNIIEFLKVENVPYTNRIWPTAVAGEADSVSSVSASACHICGPKGVTPRYYVVSLSTLEPISQTFFRIASV